MINPFRRRAQVAAEEAERLAALPKFEDIDPADFLRAGDIERLVEVARQTEDLRTHQREADELQRRADALDAAVSGHEAAERDQAAFVAATTKRLEESRRQLVATVKAADSAMAALHAAAEGHDALVVQSAAELRAAGLADSYVDGDAVVHFETGGTPASGLLIAGKVWTRLDARVVLKRALFGALRGRYGDRDVEVTRLRLTTPVGQLDRRIAGLLDGAPVPKSPRAGASLFAATLTERAAWWADALDAARPRLSEDALDRQRRLHKEDEGARVLKARRAAIVKEKGQAYLDKLDARVAEGWSGEPIKIDADA